MSSTAASHVLRRVLVLADESASWKVAGLRQLDRLALTLHEAMRSADESVTMCVLWAPQVPLEQRWTPAETRIAGLTIAEDTGKVLREKEPLDLIVSTRVFLHRNGGVQALTALPMPEVPETCEADLWSSYAALAEEFASETDQPWRYLRSSAEIAACERDFLRRAGKSQDGLVSRRVNRPISRTISRLLLKLPVTPNSWSVSIFALPLCACVFLLRGTDLSFLWGCLIFQIYSIVDGCDGEIARAKFLQTEFGRRLDSLLDLIGNVLLALCLGIGLAHQWQRTQGSGWFYIVEAVAAATFILLSEGIVFSRRSRGETVARPATKWNGALYQRHHEFFERSGVLVLGEKCAWWLVQFTKRDMAMLGFLLLAAVGWAEGILHLLLAVSAVSSALAGNAFLRQPAPAVAQEAS